MLPYSELNLPPQNLSLAFDEKGRKVVYDICRQIWVVLTPEEWVRQNFVHFMIGNLGYPQALIANERAIEFNDMRRRCDTVVFTRDLRPWLIVEYKSPRVKISEKTFDQIARYNSVLGAEYLIVTNGLTHFCCRFNGETYTFLPQLPRF